MTINILLYKKTYNINKYFIIQGDVLHENVYRGIHKMYNDNVYFLLYKKVYIYI